MPEEYEAENEMADGEDMEAYRAGVFEAMREDDAINRTSERVN